MVGPPNLAVLGRPPRRFRLVDKLHCYECGTASRFKYILTTDRRDRLHHGRRCANSSRVFWATHRYLEDSATRLVFHSQPTQRDLATQYLRVKWFRGLVSRGVLDEPAALGTPAAFLSKQLVALVAIRRGMGVLPPAAEVEAGDGDDESEVSEDEQEDEMEVSEGEQEVSKGEMEAEH